MNDEEVMRACQTGFGNYRGALNDAHDLLAECYGTIGRLILKNEVMRNELCFLYGQDEIPRQYKLSIKRAIDE